MGLRHGDVLTTEFHKPRSGKYHRRVFALLQMVFENQDRFDHLEVLRQFLTLQTSFVIESLDHATGEVIRLPRSWEYSQMDQTEFEALNSELIDAVLRCFYPTEDENWLKNGLEYHCFANNVLGFV